MRTAGRGGKRRRIKRDLDSSQILPPTARGTPFMTLSYDIQTASLLLLCLQNPDSLSDEKSQGQENPRE